MRQDVHGSKQREADEHVGEHADAIVAPLEQAQVDERLLDGELDRHKDRQEHHGHDGEAEDEGRLEPVVFIAFLEHGLQRRQADGHRDDAGPIALPQQREFHRLALEREPQCGDHDVDEENGLPAVIFGEIAADGRPDCGRKGDG